MNKFSISDVKIAALASAIPKKRSSETGAYWVSEFQTAGDLGFSAAQCAIEELGVSVAEIGILVFVSQTPDYRSPATACVLQSRLGLPVDCIVFDINLSGAGFIYGIAIVGSLLSRINCRYGLLITGDTLSKQMAPSELYPDWKVGDSTSALLLESAQISDDLHVFTGTDGNAINSMILPSGAFRMQHPSNGFIKAEDAGSDQEDSLRVDVQGLHDFFSNEIPQAFQEYVASCGSETADFDSFALTQFSEGLVQELAHRLRIPAEKVLKNSRQMGYAGAGSIPLLISDHYGHVKGNKCSRVLACGLGEGLSWGFADFTICADAVLPVIETDDFYTEGAVSHDI